MTTNCSVTKYNLYSAARGCNLRIITITKVLTGNFHYIPTWHTYTNKPYLFFYLLVLGGKTHFFWVQPLCSGNSNCFFWFYDAILLYISATYIGNLYISRNVPNLFKKSCCIHKRIHGSCTKLRWVTETQDFFPRNPRFAANLMLYVEIVFLHCYLSFCTDYFVSTRNPNKKDKSTFIKN